jgi:aspartyl-tRNA(Asn)/glutamyl-tRNA(Gln) amidotransferase subunit A
MTYSTLNQIQSAIQNGETTCVALVEHYLKNIEANQHLNVFLEVYTDEARQQAILIDAKIKAGKAGRLAGMVIGIKDVLAHQNHGLQAGSQILNGFVSQFTATAVQRILAEDAIIIGRQNCDEFAMGSSNENSSFGPTRNFADPSRVPGGSSGASAVAVQADMCLASLGSDTGGSVRQPAAFCGVVGFKPTYSRVSRWGLIAYASSFDCIGPITKNIDDAALLLEIIAGADQHDSTVSQQAVPQFSLNLAQSEGKKYRIAYMREAIESEGLSAEIKAKTMAILEQCKAAGHVVEAVDFPLIKYSLPTYYILTTAEASSNLNRFDGVRYGHRSKSATDLISLYKKSRAEGFGAEVKRRIMLGTFVLSADYYDAYYTKAQRVRRLIQNANNDIFKNYDFLVSPTTPTTAFKIGEKSENQLEMFLADLFTVTANVTGQPAVSIPNGISDEGLPIGFQIMANHFEEEKLLKFAKEIEGIGKLVN